MNLRSALIVCFGLTLCACPSDDPEGDGDTTNADTGTPGTTTGMTMTTMAAEGSSGMATTMSADSTDGGSSDTAPACDPADEANIAMCRDSAMMMGSCEMVYGCVCDSCSCQLGACEQDAGCVAIRECAQMTGCTGLECYMMETCQEVIDANGGPVGDSASIAIDLSACTEMAKCPIQCPGGTGTDTGDSGSSGSDSGGSESGSSTG